MLVGTNPPSCGGVYALVIGGSVVGLLAARVLSERFERVTVIERDQFPKDPSSARESPNPGTCTRS